MRRLLTFIVVMATAPLVALAQQAEAPGPFQVGMSIDDARAVLPAESWREQEMPEEAPLRMLMSVMPVNVGGNPFMPALEFHDGVLQTVRYGRPSIVADEAACVALTAQTVQSFESSGAFAGERGGGEPEGAPTLTQTAAGSVLRSYAANDAGEVFTYANRRGEMFAEVMSMYSMRPFPDENGALVPACILMVEFGRDMLPPPIVAVDAPSVAELEAATLLTGATFIEQPEGRDYALWYPPAAMRDEIEGRVTLDCLVAADGYLRCAISSEEPVGAGFGQAAQQVSTRFRLPAEHEGAPTAGKRIRRTIVFRLG